MEFNFKLETSKTPNLETTIAEYNVDEATVTVADNKLVLSKEAVKALGGVAGDRIVVNY